MKVVPRAMEGPKLGPSEVGRKKNIQDPCQSLPLWVRRHWAASNRRARQQSPQQGGAVFVPRQGD